MSSTMKYKVNKVVERASLVKRLEDLTLTGSKVKFCPDQLQNLNYIFRQKVEQHLESIDENYVLAKSVSERFLQRLICNVGMLDDRFCSKYLIPLEYQDASKTLKYLFRIDALSTPVLYQSDSEPRYEILQDEVHAGYTKIQLHESMLNNWGQFTNCTGYLRRDKVQSKVVELLAKAAANTDLFSSENIDESVLCGSPSKVINAATLHKILHVSTEKHIYYGTGASNNNFPNPMDFRIAIVDEPDGIRIHLEFLSQALSHISLDIRLLVAIGVDFWPTSTDFPFRISLGHTDCLLYHKASKTGMYLVGFGVHSSAWQIRFPAAESIILNHYNPESTPRIILQITSIILSEISNLYEDRKQMNTKMLTNHILRTALFYELENDKSHPTSTIINWSPLYLSTLILKILDKLVLDLQKEHYSDYFFPKANLIANPGHFCEEDYLVESHKIQQYIMKLFDEALLSKWMDKENYPTMVASIKSEAIFLGKWKEVVDKMPPPRSNRATRMSLAFSTNGSDALITQYTQRQMEYIGILLKHVVSVRENVWKNDHNGWINLRKPSNNPVEDIIYLLVTILEQARDTYMRKCPDAKIREKIRLNFSLSINKLVQLVRKDADITLEIIQDDIQMVKIILKWLYKSMDQSKKYFAPILRPYLNLLFDTSHAVSWHIEDIKKSFENDELNSLGIFARLVNKGKLSPALGLVDAYNKKWIWAKDMIELLETGKLKLIFIPGRSRVFRHILLATKCKRDIFKGDDVRALRNSVTLTTRSYFDALPIKANITSVSLMLPIHNILKQQSPMIRALRMMNRSGDHRCAGDIFRSLFSMHRINVLQEVASALHPDYRANILDYIQMLTEAKEMKRSDKVWSKILPRPQKGVLPPDDLPKEKYTPLEESAGIKSKEEDEEAELQELIERLDSKESLLGSCRAARIRDNRSLLYLQDPLY